MSTRFVCSVASRERDEPVWATASIVRRWLLVEVDGSWGSDAVADSELGPHAPAVWRRAMKQRGIRVVTIRRGVGADAPFAAPGMRLVYAVTGRPGRNEPAAYRRVVTDLGQVVRATESLLAEPEPDAQWEPDQTPYLLVCTNGRHDSCCASEGRPLVRHLRESQWARDVWECSHIGGDRFAGNVVVLPDGLYFGRCKAERIDDVLERLTARGELDPDHFRGRAGFSWLEQAAEHFLHEHLGDDRRGLVTGARTASDGVVELGIDDGRTFRVTIDRHDVEVVTPLTCKGTTGQTVPRFDLVDLAET